MQIHCLGGAEHSLLITVGVLIIVFEINFLFLVVGIVFRTARTVFSAARTSGALFVFLLLAFVFRSSVLEPDFDLGLAQTKMTGELFAFIAHDVVILLKGLLKLQQLSGTERRSDAF